MLKPEYRHATCVSMDGRGILLMGPSGSGKSDLALRLIGKGAILVADDQVMLASDEGNLFASCPAPIAGKLEMRGVGIISLPYIEQVPLKLVVTLVLPEQVERVPEPKFFDCFEIEVPLLSLHAFDLSTPDKIILYLNSLAA